jgi:hypothetical protein
MLAAAVTVAVHSSPAGAQRLLTFDAGPLSYLKVVDHGPSRRSIVLRLDAAFPCNADQTGLHGDLFSLGIYPSSGAQLQVFNSSGTDDNVCYALDSSLWSLRSFAHGPPKLSYLDDETRLTPVYRVREVTNPGRFSHFKDILKFQTSPQNALISYDLDEPQQASIGVSFDVPIGTHCPPSAMCTHPYAATVGDPCSADTDCGGAPGSCQDTVVRLCGDFTPHTDKPGMFRSMAVAPCATAPPCP